jgi:hypothetical protein
VLNDDGNISHAVHQHDRFSPAIDDFVSQLSQHRCPERVRRKRDLSVSAFLIGCPERGARSGNWDEVRLNATEGTTR